MDRKEIVNSQDYKATKAALEWWYSLPKEQRQATDIDAEPDIVDAYTEGVIYGWNNPQWVPVEEELPKEKGKYMFRLSNGDMCYETYYPKLKLVANVTHWMEIVPPQGKEEEV